MCFRFLPRTWLPALFFAFAFNIAGARLYAQDLSISGGDLWVSQGADGGYHLYIRKKPDINSVLLAETTRDPSLREPNYAYRTDKWNPINGEELRVIDGVPLSQNNGWSLIASKTEYVPAVGEEVFHIYIPYIVYYGYPNTRNGSVYVGNGTYFNIRAFNLPYGDYRGSFMDNPFMLEVTQEPLEGPPEENYMKDTAESFANIASLNGGRLFRSRGPEDIAEILSRIISEEQNTSSELDLVICLDTTASMRDDIAALRSRLVKYVSGIKERFTFFRVGVVLFRDYKDSYLTKVLPFTSDLAVFQKTLNAAQAAGGGDIPEAVFEGLFDAVTKYEWLASSRLVVLIGDAPPHPLPRGNITEASVAAAARKNGVRISAVMLPQ